MRFKDFYIKEEVDLKYKKQWTTNVKKQIPDELKLKLAKQKNFTHQSHQIWTDQWDNEFKWDENKKKFIDVKDLPKSGTKEIFTDLQGMLDASTFSFFKGDRLKSKEYQEKNKDRIDRMKNVSRGEDLSTYAEIISDWREYLNSLKVYDGNGDIKDFDIDKKTYDKIKNEIDNIYKIREKRNLLNKQVGN
jgi:hypothetical protein